MDEGRCPVCSQRCGSEAYRCRACLVPHHRDCWNWNRRCGIYACLGRDYRAPAAVLDLVEARVRLLSLVLTGCLALATLALSWVRGAPY